MTNKEQLERVAEDIQRLADNVKNHTPSSHWMPLPNPPEGETK